MDPITIGLLLGAGGGLLKSQFSDAPKEERQRRLAAETERLSPWTGMHGKPVEESDAFGSILQFGATGAALGANYGKQASEERLNNAMAEFYNPKNLQKPVYGPVPAPAPMGDEAEPTAPPPPSSGPSFIGPTGPGGQILESDDGGGWLIRSPKAARRAPAGLSPLGAGTQSFDPGVETQSYNTRPDPRKLPPPSVWDLRKFRGQQ